jgi:hypothetical protein
VWCAGAGLIKKQCRGSYAEFKKTEIERAESELEGIFLFFFGAHGKKGRGNDHTEKYQCKNKIVDHWGVSFWAALAVLEQ